MRFSKITFFLFSFSFFFTACGDDDTARSRPTPDVSTIKIDLQLQHFDQDLWPIDTNQLVGGVDFLMKKHPEFTTILLKNILRDPRNPKETDAEILGSLLRPSEFRGLKDSISAIFGDYSTEKKELTRLMQFYHYYFPQKTIPKFLTVFTGYGYGAFPVSDSLFCIGSEFFLGENHPPYTQLLDLPAYVQTRMNKKYVVSQVAEALALDVVSEPKGARLFDEMFANGKAFYLKDCLLPETPDSIKWGFNQSQLDWCKQNELEVWSYLLQQKLLYATDRKKFRKLIEESPNAGDSPPALRDAPGRVGNWLGYRIVGAWMRRHPTADLAELLAQNDPQKFLEAARYKPKKR
jgi:hypothetical protein